MSDVKKSTQGAVAHFDGMVWPIPSDRVARVEWALRHGTPTRLDLMLAAEVIAAYRQMVNDPRSKREHVVRTLREVMR